MAFSSLPGYGFTAKDVRPWQRFNPYSERYNAETSSKEKDGILPFFRKINQFREENPVLTYGNIDFDSFDDGQKDVLSYTRTWEGKRMLILINLSNHKRRVPEKVKELSQKTLLLSNYNDRKENLLRPYEALIYSW